MIVPGKSRPFIAPLPAPIMALRVRVRHQVRVIYAHLPGVAKGSLVYSDLNAYAWYAGSAGFETRPGPGISINRYLKGLEDNDERQAR